MKFQRSVGGLTLIRPKFLVWSQSELVADHRELLRTPFDLIVQLPIPIAIIVECIVLSLSKCQEGTYTLWCLGVYHKPSPK